MTKDKKVLIYISITILALYLIKKKIEKNDESFLQPAVVSTQSANTGQGAGVATSDALPSNGSASTAQSAKDSPSNASVVGAPQIIDESKTLLKTFQADNKLQIPDFFQSYNFQKIPTAVDSQTDGIIAKDQADGITMGIFSRRTSPDPAELKKFISQEVAEVLAMSIPTSALEKPVQEKPKPDSGFSAVTVWTVRDKNKIVVISLANRADNQGVYLNIISGEAEYLQKKEDYLEERLGKFKSY